MPEHTTWFTLLLAYMHETLEQNAHAFGETVIKHEAPSWRSFEPLAAALFVTLIVLGIALRVRSRLSNPDDAVVPEEQLTLRTFMEAFLSYFYDLAKSVMDAERAKKYFPLIGTAAMFVFFSNVLALIPGFPVATSSLSITLGCAIVVFVCFNAYGLATMAGRTLPTWPVRPGICAAGVSDRGRFAVRATDHPGRSLDAEHGRRPPDSGHFS